MSLKPKKVSEIKKIQEKMYSKTREDLFDVLSEKGPLEDAKKTCTKNVSGIFGCKNIKYVCNGSCNQSI